VPSVLPSSTTMISLSGIRWAKTESKARAIKNRALKAGMTVLMRIDRAGRMAFLATFFSSVGVSTVLCPRE
jgi:hypothetical protein